MTDRALQRQKRRALTTTALLSDDEGSLQPGVIVPRDRPEGKSPMLNAPTQLRWCRDCGSFTHADSHHCDDTVTRRLVMSGGPIDDATKNSWIARMANLPRRVAA